MPTMGRGYPFCKRPSRNMTQPIFLHGLNRCLWCRVPSDNLSLYPLSPPLRTAMAGKAGMGVQHGNPFPVAMEEVVELHGFRERLLEYSGGVLNADFDLGKPCVLAGGAVALCAASSQVRKRLVCQKA